MICRFLADRGSVFFTAKVGCLACVAFLLLVPGVSGLVILDQEATKFEVELRSHVRYLHDFCRLHLLQFAEVLVWY